MAQWTIAICTSCCWWWRVELLATWVSYVILLKSCNCNGCENGVCELEAIYSLTSPLKLSSGCMHRLGNMVADRDVEKGLIKMFTS